MAGTAIHTKSGKILKKPSNGFNRIWPLFLGLLVYGFSNENILLALITAGVAAAAIIAYGRLRRHKQQNFARINENSIYFFDNETEYFWMDYATVFHHQRHLLSNKSGEEELQLAVTPDDSDEPSVSLTISSLQCDLDELHNALLEYCPVYTSEETGVRESIAFDLKNARLPGELADIFLDSERRASAGALISLIPVVAGGICQYYFTFPFAFSCGLAIALGTHCINIEISRNRFFRACAEQGISESAGLAVIKTYGTSINYDNTGNRGMFYTVMALGAAMSFIIQYGIMNE